MALLRHSEFHTKLADPGSKEMASEGVFGVAVIVFELRLHSLAICDFEVAAIRVTKPAKILGHPGFLPSRPKEDKLSREGTNFSTTTPSRGRPPPHPVGSRPKKLIFVLFFLA